LKETEAFWQNKLEAEANSKATNFIQRRKRKQKFPRVRKRKQTRKRPTLSRAGSGSKNSQEWGSGSKLRSM